MSCSTPSTTTDRTVDNLGETGLELGGLKDGGGVIGILLDDAGSDTLGILL